MKDWVIDLLKSFGVGLGVLLIGAWVLYAAVFAIAALMSAGAAIAGMPLWLIILALIPWVLLALSIIAMIGDDIRRKH